MLAERAGGGRWGLGELAELKRWPKHAGVALGPASLNLIVSPSLRRCCSLSATGRWNSQAGRKSASQKVTYRPVREGEVSGLRSVSGTSAEVMERADLLCSRFGAELLASNLRGVSSPLLNLRMALTHPSATNSLTISNILTSETRGQNDLSHSCIHWSGSVAVPQEGAFSSKVPKSPP